MQAGRAADFLSDILGMRTRWKLGKNSNKLKADVSLCFEVAVIQTSRRLNPRGLSAALDGGS